MAASTFNIDEKMDATLEALKEHYGATSKAEILRKAIALLNVAKDAEQSDGSLVIRKGGEDLKVLVR